MVKKRQLQISSCKSLSRLVLLILSCLSHLCHSQASLCQQVVDSGGSVYGLEDQILEDSRVCQPSSSVFIREGVRYCFSKQEGETGGGVYTELKCGIKPPESVPECREPACQEFSKALIDSMDHSVQPCEDFYQFACGKETGNDAMTDQIRLFMTRMKELLKDPPNQNQDLSWEQNLRCMLQ